MPASPRKGNAQLRDLFREAFDKLGGSDFLVDFATRNDGNARVFVQCVSKLLPQNVEMSVSSIKLENMTDEDIEKMSITELTKFIIDAEYEVITPDRAPARRVA